MRSLLDAQTQPAAPAIGFTNLHDACSTFPVDVFGSPAFAVPPARGNAASICHNPGEYIFWDHVRPKGQGIHPHTASRV